MSLLQHDVETNAHATGTHVSGETGVHDQTAVTTKCDVDCAQQGHACQSCHSVLGRDTEGRANKREAARRRLLARQRVGADHPHPVTVRPTGLVGMEHVLNDPQRWGVQDVRGLVDDWHDLVADRLFTRLAGRWAPYGSQLVATAWMRAWDSHTILLGAHPDSTQEFVPVVDVRLLVVRILSPRRVVVELYAPQATPPVAGRLADLGNLVQLRHWQLEVQPHSAPNGFNSYTEPGVMWAAMNVVNWLGDLIVTPPNHDAWTVPFVAPSLTSPHGILLTSLRITGGGQPAWLTAAVADDAAFMSMSDATDYCVVTGYLETLTGDLAAEFARDLETNRIVLTGTQSFWTPSGPWGCNHIPVAASETFESRAVRVPALYGWGVTMGKGLTHDTPVSVCIPGFNNAIVVGG